MPKTEQTKRAYVEATGKAPSGPAFEKWLEKKTGGDYSDSNMAKVFGGGGDPAPLKKGEKTIPQKEYMSETSKKHDMIPYEKNKFEKDWAEMRPMKLKKKSVEIGVSDSKKKEAIDRVKANMVATEARQKRFKQSTIESY